MRRETEREAGAGTPGLAGLLDRVGRGRWLPADAAVTVVPPPSGRSHGVFGFTGCHVIATDADPAWVLARIPPGNLSVPLGPSFLGALAERTGRRVDSIDVVAVADALPGPPPALLGRPLEEVGGANHRRVLRALGHRDEVRAWTVPGGVVILGRGVAGRWEAAVEVDEPDRTRGLGRSLMTAVRHLVPDGSLVWAQIAAANAASLRAIQAAGFRPVGAEALLVGG